MSTTISSLKNEEMEFLRLCHCFCLFALCCVCWSFPFHFKAEEKNREFPPHFGCIHGCESPGGPRGSRGQRSGACVLCPWLQVGFVSEVPEHLSLEMRPHFQCLHMLGLRGSQSGLYSSLIFKELPKFGGTRKEELRKPTESKAIVNVCLLGSST